MKYLSGFVPGCDGTPLFYQATGRGPDIIACNGIGVSTFFWKYIQEYFSQSFRFITWDYRGHGRSAFPRDPGRLSMETLAEDLKHVATHLEVDQAILMGHSMGVQVILEFYRLCPSLVSSLIPVLGSFKRPLDTFMDSSLSRPIFDRIVAFSKRHPRLLAKITPRVLDPRFGIRSAQLVGMVDRFYCPIEDIRQYLEHLSSLNPHLLLQMAVAMADHSAEDLLPNIRVPTLIVAGERDLFTPVYLSLEMQRRIPGAELLMLRGGSHAALIEQPELMIHRIEKFIEQHPLTIPASPSPKALQLDACA